jgi:hypothetical protein
VKRPRSKADRVVSAEVLIQAGLTLMQEAELSETMTDLGRALPDQTQELCRLGNWPQLFEGRGQMVDRAVGVGDKGKACGRATR